MVTHGHAFANITRWMDHVSSKLSFMESLLDSLKERVDCMDSGHPDDPEPDDRFTASFRRSSYGLVHVVIDLSETVTKLAVRVADLETAVDGKQDTFGK